jgi:flagellar biosynthesis anti-sigma factor FlgM
MKVNHPASPSVSRSDVSKTGGAHKAAHGKKTDGAGAAAQGRSAEGAKAEISSRGKEMATAKAAAASASDVREDRIAELKRRIQAGTYKVDADKVADRMVDDHLSAGIG